MIESDNVIRVCGEIESQQLHQLNKSGYHYYYHWYEGDDEYHYILVDDRNYRLRYKKVEPNKISFTGEAVELEENSSEFID